MKRILSVLILASVLLCSFAACGNKMTEDFVVGEWNSYGEIPGGGSSQYFVADIYWDETMIIKEDGTLTTTTDYSRTGKSWSREYEGTWRIVGEELVCEINDSDDTPRQMTLKIGKKGTLEGAGTWTKVK